MIKVLTKLFTCGKESQVEDSIITKEKSLSILKLSSNCKIDTEVNKM